MLNASVKELEKQTFTFHSVAPTDRVADLMAVVEDNSYVKQDTLTLRLRSLSLFLSEAY
jgi:hypothetical protein